MVDFMYLLDYSEGGHIEEYISKCFCKNISRKINI